MLSHINEERTAIGLNTLTPADSLDAAAEDTAVRMRDAWVTGGCSADAGAYLVHTADLVGHYRPERVTAYPRGVAENIAFSTDRINSFGGSREAMVDDLHSRYMGSARHRANNLGDWQWVGTAIVMGPTVAQSAAGACPGAEPNTTMFSANVFVR